jgi:hypothetical protein
MGQLSPGLTGVALALGLCALVDFAGSAAAAPAVSAIDRQSDPTVSSHGLTAEEFSAQSRKILHRTPRRIRIYGPREPGPNSVRICSSYYEYEYRVSGTVIVPRESCYWSG